MKILLPIDEPACRFIMFVEVSNITITISCATLVLTSQETFYYAMLKTQKISSPYICVIFFNLILMRKYIFHKVLLG